MYTFVQQRYIELINVKNIKGIYNVENISVTLF